MKRFYSLLLSVFSVATLFAQAPANDSCSNAMLLLPGANPIFDTIQIDGATSDITGCGRSEDIWFKFEVPASGGIRIETQAVDLNYRPYVRLYEGTCGSFTPYACSGNCQYWSTTNCSDELLLHDPSLAGDTVYLRMSKRFSHSGIRGAIRILEINTSDFPANDACENAVDISANLYSPESDTFSLKNSIVETNMSTCGNDEDVWVKFAVPADGGFEMATEALNPGNYDEFFRIYTGGCTSLSEYACTGTCENYGSGNCNSYRRIVNPAIAGDTLWVKIANRFNNDDRDSFSLNITEIPSSEFAKHDSCEAAKEITASLYSTVLDSLSLENAIVETNMSTCGLDEDIWVKFEVPSSGAFEMETFALNPGNYDEYFRIYTGGCASLSEYQCTGTCDNYGAGNCNDYRMIVDPSIAGDTVWVRLSNRFSIDDRDSFLLEIKEVPATELVSNDSCGAAYDLSGMMGIESDTFTLKNALVELDISSCGEDRDVWFKFKVPTNGGFEIETNQLDATYDQYFTAYSGGCASLSAYSCATGNCNKSQATNCGEFLRVIDSTLAGDTMWVRVSNRFTSVPGEEFTIRVDTIGDDLLKSNDDCAGALPLSVTTGNCALDTFDNNKTTYSNVPTGACGSYSGADVWFSFVMPPSDDVFVSMEQVGLSTSNFRIVAYSGGCASLVEESCNSSGSYPDLSIRNLGLAGDTVRLQVYIESSNIIGDTFGLCVKDTVVPPLRTAVGQYTKTTNCNVLNGNGWFDLTDTSGNLVMSIDPNSAYLGRTCFGVEVRDSAASITEATDTSGNTAFLGPRTWFINPTSFSGAIVRLYYTERELAIWRDSLANRGVGVGPSLESFYQDSMRISKTDGEDLNNPLGDNPVQINPTVTKVRDSIVMAEFSVTTFSNFVTVFNPGNLTTPVPVEWLSFKGEKYNDVVRLLWATASELNCSHFEVQQSMDGVTWRVIDVVEGNGTTNTISRYANSHINTRNAKTYYRLKQIDYDGSFDFSHVVAIKAQSSIQVSPNPFRDMLKISGGKDEIEQVILFDIYGREVYKTDVHANQTKINLHNEIDHGVYTLRVITAYGVIDKKVVKE